MSSAFIFDFDGTLVDTERLQVKAWHKVLEPLGYKNYDQILLAMIGKTTLESNQIIMDRLIKGMHNIDELRANKNAIFDQFIADDIPLKPGVIQILHHLKTQEISCGVVSSTIRKNLITRLNRAGLLHYFSVIVGGDEVIKGKPDPTCFLLGAERLSVNPNNCIVIEDSVYGVEAARNAGMKVVFIKDLVDLPETSIKDVDQFLSLEEYFESEMR